MQNSPNKNALIFGGASGIGGATARIMIEQGARVTIADVRRPSGWADEAAQYIDCDVRDPEQVSNAVRCAAAQTPLDWLVYSTGIQHYGSVVSTPVEEYDLVQAINSRGAFLACRAAIPEMRNGGAIVLVSSVQALATQKGVAAYAASKGTLEALMRAMAVDHAKDNIRVNSVLPGTVDTPMVRSSAERFGGTNGLEQTLQQWGDNHPLGRVAHAEEIANLIAFLLSDKASFITGASYRVDGGLLAQLAVRL
ncbi:SDR family NAD(P)-dependent oxidoreductase [Granulicella mallensis]|jgi:NAD(P)-dependent dehydrogenase (short-subunit alcohol dehydrogenase family)|uniref:NAD(P)-dependent dehydrogenase (Short-subunit alcohol dehydrogenase family) n=1 Tax=Granulicella mallensis TaxID=940614 RepID=A0A7W7ZKV5_9BACT|nr:SDR family oxidoreductase [Granulicella mallensis]MBB5061776.1 NAD(P)-dependent dehydrogenase (short-subunit alcohol dehydrogenase family) [Granulicella mallensis]